MRRLDRSRPSPGPRPVVALTALGAVTVLLLAGCSGEQEDTGAAAASSSSEDTGMGHVHGLGVDGASGDVLVATHTGLFRLQDGSEPQRVTDRKQDTMGFTVDGDRLLGSGHPDPRDGLPSHLGLVESSDAGESWTAVSLQGDADFHTLTVSGEAVVGWDSLSGAVLASSDGGRSWSAGAELDVVADLEHLPDDAGLVATTADGLLVSRDAGRSFQTFSPAPPTTLVHVESAGQAVTGVDVEGGVWDLTGAAWVARGSIGAPPAAFAASPDGTLLAATAEEVLRLDGGTWTALADVAGTPVMRPSTVAAGGVLLCLGLLVAVLVGSRGPGPLDQPDRANQRNGLLLAGPTVDASLPGLTPGRGPTVLLFVRAAPGQDVVQDWRRMLPPTTHVVLVVQEPGATAPGPAAEAAAAAGVDLVVDREGRLADAVNLPEPVDGGPGIGYAVVDTHGVVRYSTLDPAWPDNAFEVDTVVGATS